MKKSRLLAFLLALCMVISLMPAAFAEETEPTVSDTPTQGEASDTYQFAVLSTTDMHGRATDKDVSTQRTDNNCMERVATAVSKVRAEYGKENTILIDNGDTIQGTLVAQYAITQKQTLENPMITALKYIGYDVWGMGNHEFNFTPEQRDVQTKIADDAGISVLSANLTLLEDGVNFRGDATQAGDSYYDPYVIKTLDAGNGRTVRVAIIGIGNAANATWDLATNYPNLQFSSLDNPDGELEYEINKWTKKITDADLADIIIVAAHTGRGSDVGYDLESQAYTGAANSSNVDLLIYGHDHRANIEKVTNADGEEIYIVNGGGSTVTENIFTVSFDENGKVSDFTVTADAIKLSETDADETLTGLLQGWYDDTYAWASKPLGTFDNGWDDVKSEAEGKRNNDMVLSQTQLSNFIHKAQIWASWQSYEDEGIEGAVVSIASPVFGTVAGGALSFVPSDGDTVSTLELSKLYRYSNNLLCAVDMTPKQLYNWMSAVADMYTIKDGKPAVAEGVSVFGLDTFYGIDYTFDLTKPLGERVVSASINGVDLLKIEGKIRVALNSYRLSGGYGFYEATDGLSEADCCWTASQYLGADRAPVPTQIGEYVAYMGTVSPTDKVSHGQDSTWTLLTGSESFVNPFSDVSESDWYYDSVMKLAESGIVNGVSGNEFMPNASCTRAQAVTMLWRAAGCPDAKITDVPFTDVKAGSYYEKAVLWAYENKITLGTSDTTFSPDNSCTRAQIITMLWRANGSKAPAAKCEFADVAAVGSYYYDAVAWAAENGITNGTSKTTFSPDSVCTRAQLAAFIARADSK